MTDSERIIQYLAYVALQGETGGHGLTYALEQLCQKLDVQPAWMGEGLLAIPTIILLCRKAMEGE